MTTTASRARAPRIDSDPADDWRTHRHCRNEDAELFYPLGGEGSHRRTGNNLLQEEMAKAICRRCPVREKCLAFALDVKEDWGIWGGLNEAERRNLRDGRPVRYPQYCRRCSDPFDADPENPHARLCPGCVTYDVLRKRKRPSVAVSP